MYRSALGKARQKGCPKNINDIEDVLVLPGNNRRKTVNTDIFSKYRYWNRVLIRIFLQYIKKQVCIRIQLDPELAPDPEQHLKTEVLAGSGLTEKFYRSAAMIACIV